MDHPTVGAISEMFGDQFGPIEGIVGSRSSAGSPPP